MKLKELPTQELIKELRKRGIDCHPLNIPFTYQPKEEITNSTIKDKPC